MELLEHTQKQIWTLDYPVHYAGLDFSARMTVIRLPDGRVMLHSPCEIDAPLSERLRELGDVTFIVAPGTYHYFHIASAQAAFPEAETWICPGIERKRPELEFDWFLSDRSPPEWADTLEQGLVRGNRFIWEVAFLHKPSRTLILVDLIENVGDTTPGTDWKLKLWWKAAFHMWNRPKPAPEYQLGWKDRKAAQASLQRILEWEFDRIIISHGDNIDADAKTVARSAWRNPLLGG